MLESIPAWKHWFTFGFWPPKTEIGVYHSQCVVYHTVYDTCYIYIPSDCCCLYLERFIRVGCSPDDGTQSFRARTSEKRSKNELVCKRELGREWILQRLTSRLGEEFSQTLRIILPRHYAVLHNFCEEDKCSNTLLEKRLNRSEEVRTSHCLTRLYLYFIFVSISARKLTATFFLGRKRTVVQ